MKQPSISGRGRGVVDLVTRLHVGGRIRLAALSGSGGKCASSGMVFRVIINGDEVK
jgi:hypothetical protein